MVSSIYFQAQFATGTSPIPVLASPSTTGLELPSTHSNDYGFTPGILPYALRASVAALLCSNRSWRFSQFQPYVPSHLRSATFRDTGAINGLTT